MNNKPKLKTSNLIIKLSDEDKEALRYLATKRGMPMSELVTYLIRREWDFDRLGLQPAAK